MLWSSGICSQSCCGRFSGGSQVSRGKDVVLLFCLEQFIAVGIHIYAYSEHWLALVLQLSVLVELLPLSGVPNASIIVAVSVLPRNLVSTKPRLCIKALNSNTKEGSVATWRLVLMSYFSLRGQCCFVWSCKWKLKDAARNKKSPTFLTLSF